MKKRTKSILIGLIVFAISYVLAVELYRFMVERLVDREAREARNLALAEMSPESTAAQAREWLEDHGYQVVVWNPHHPEGFVGTQLVGSEPRHFVVTGHRRIRRGTWLDDPQYVMITFLFTLDGAFEDVEARGLGYAWPSAAAQTEALKEDPP